MENKTLNQKTLAVLAPLLILTGIAGFLIPERYTVMSGAAPYNLFHIIFGVAGLWLVMTNSDLWASAFNLVFGLIDLYQALASHTIAASRQSQRTSPMCHRATGATRYTAAISSHEKLAAIATNGSA